MLPGFSDFPFDASQQKKLSFKERQTFFFKTINIIQLTNGIKKLCINSAANSFVSNSPRFNS